jgi:kumamolisin
MAKKKARRSTRPSSSSRTPAARAKKGPPRAVQPKAPRGGVRVTVTGSNRSVVRNATRIGDVPADAPVKVTLTLRGPPLPSADQLPARALSPAEFSASFGASAADAEQVTQALQRYGLTVSDVSLPTRSMQVSGTAAQMQAAFGPQLGIYRDATGREFRDRQGTYGVPKEIAGIVTSILGFGQRQVARRREAQVVAASTGTSLAPLTPADIEKLYQFPADPGAAPTIGIAEFGGGYFEQDLQAYCTKFNRKVPLVKAIPVNRPAYTLQDILKLPPGQRQQALGESVEVNMDIQLIAGLCPSSVISVYFASFDQKGWVDLLDRVITDRPVALSVSWGLAEDDPAWSSAARDAVTQRLTSAALLGITVCVSSGDDGSGDQETDNRAHVDFPGASPFVLCVGGTMLNGATLTPSAEVVWWEAPGRRTGQGGGSSGGGVSALYPRPQWQTVRIASLNKGSIDGRVVPDVAAVAGPPLYDLIFAGKDSPNGGTSASTPVWAALLTRVNAVLPVAKRQRFLAPLLYAAGTGGNTMGSVVCNDVTKGNNTSNPPGRGYAATAGFDAVTGWGTPRGVALVNALS